MLFKKEEGGGRTWRKKNLKLQPYLDFWASQLERDFCPAYVLLQCLSVLVSLLLPSSVSFLVRSSLYTSPIALLTPPHFPYFGMSMCYLLTLCMNDNMYVYRYNRVPLSWCWLTMVWMLYRFRFSVHLCFVFFILVPFMMYVELKTVCFFNLINDSSFCLEVTCTLIQFLLSLFLLKRQYLLLLNERGDLNKVMYLKWSIWEPHGYFRTLLATSITMVVFPEGGTGLLNIMNKNSNIASNNKNVYILYSVRSEIGPAHLP